MAVVAAPGELALRHHLPEVVEARQEGCIAHSGVAAVHRNQGQVRPRNKRGRAQLLPDLNHSLHVRKTSHQDRLKAHLPAILSMAAHSDHLTGVQGAVPLRAKTVLLMIPVKAGMPMCQATGPIVLPGTSQAPVAAAQPATAATQNQTKEDLLAAIGLQMPTGHQALTGHQVATGLPMPTEHRAVNVAPQAIAAREQAETRGQTEIQVPTGPVATAPVETTSTSETTTTSTSMPSATQWWW